MNESDGSHFVNGWLKIRNGNTFIMPDTQLEHWFEVVPYTVGQFTGLKDKNGKDVYEEDIILVFDEAVVPVTDEGQGPIEECNHIIPVEMRGGEWGFEIPSTDDGETGWHSIRHWAAEISSGGYEVIGNIYENPELINSQK